MGVGVLFGGKLCLQSVLVICACNLCWELLGSKLIIFLIESLMQWTILCLGAPWLKTNQCLRILNAMGNFCAWELLR